MGVIVKATWYISMSNTHTKSWPRITLRPATKATDAKATKAKASVTFVKVLNVIMAQFHGSAYPRILRLRSPFSAYCATAKFLR